MEAKYIGAAVGFIMGSVGYVLSKFWIMPIMRFKTTRGRVLKLITRIETALDSGIIQEDWTVELRRISAMLSEKYNLMHPAYRSLLANKGVAVDEACKRMLTLANTRDAEHAKRHTESIRHSL